MLPKTKYAKSGEVHIAYQVSGDGPVDLVLAPGFVSHLEWAYEEPQLARFLERLASFSRLIAFDKRGTGLSDPVAAPTSLEERADDLRAVMDAAESQKAAILGISEGGTLAAMFAATHPERTSSLIIYGSFARFSWAPDYPDGVKPEQFEKLVQMIERWGDGTGLSAWAPSVKKDQRVRDWFAQLQRLSASPGMVKALIRLYPEIDIRALLPAIRVPTLVLHRKEDRMCTVGNGRYLAEHIPGSKFVALEGRDHIAFAGDTDGLLDEIEEFVTGVRHGPSNERVLLTVLFTDIVGSTELAERLGDNKWRELLDRYHGLVRRHIAKFRGREVDTAGDGFFATFDGPARGVRCAQAISDAVRALGIEVRSGLHTGECELSENQVRGTAVHIGARLVAMAGPSDILVSSTVKDLVVGSGLCFSDCGSSSLKGLQGEWRLFSVQGGG